MLISLKRTAELINLKSCNQQLEVWPNYHITQSGRKYALLQRKHVSAMKGFQF